MTTSAHMYESKHNFFITIRSSCRWDSFKVHSQSPARQFNV